jgi:hypothetical protein
MPVLPFAERVCFWVAQRFQRCDRPFLLIRGFSPCGPASDFFSALFSREIRSDLLDEFFRSSSRNTPS